MRLGNISNLIKSKENKKFIKIEDKLKKKQLINTPCIDRQALYNLYADYHAKKCSPLISKSLLNCLIYWLKYHQINNA